MWSDRHRLTRNMNSLGPYTNPCHVQFLSIVLWFLILRFVLRSTWNNRKSMNLKISNFTTIKHKKSFKFQMWKKNFRFQVAAGAVVVGIKSLCKNSRISLHAPSKWIRFVIIFLTQKQHSTSRLAGGTRKSTKRNERRRFDKKRNPEWIAKIKLLCKFQQKKSFLFHQKTSTIIRKKDWTSLWVALKL